MLFLPRRAGLTLALALWAWALIVPLGWCELDTMYLANGTRLQGKILQITGDFVEYRTVTGAVGLLRRIEMASRHDRIDTHGDKHYEGEIKNLGSFIAEIHTPQLGQREIWRLFINTLTLGLPESQRDPASDSDLQPEPEAHLLPAYGRR